MISVRFCRKLEGRISDGKTQTRLTGCWKGPTFPAETSLKWKSWIKLQLTNYFLKPVNLKKKEESGLLKAEEAREESEMDKVS